MNPKQAFIILAYALAILAIGMMVLSFI